MQWNYPRELTHRRAGYGDECDERGHDTEQRSDGWVWCRRCGRRLYVGRDTTIGQAALR